MTTFVTRETARDALVTLFTADGTWQAVFGYLPADSELDGQSPSLTIRSGGTQQEMASLHVNPTAYRFLLRSLVLSNDGASWTESDCEDKLDELDRQMRQVIRDNADLSTGSDYLRFDGSSSTTGYSLIGDGVLWRWEERSLFAHYAVGA